MAKSWGSSAAALVLALTLVAAASGTPGASALRFKRQHMSVNILNDLADSSILMHCRSHDDDLGQKWRAPGHWLGWGFEANVLGTTQFWCDFVNGARWQGFTVFQDIGIWGKQPRWCRQCVWVVKGDGFYRSENGVEQPSVKVHDWN